MKQLLKIQMLFLFACMMIGGATFSGCNDDNDSDKPTKLAEKLIGKWKYSKTFEKKEGTWVDISNMEVDEVWYQYNQDGSYVGYYRMGDKEMTQHLQWSIDELTGEVSVAKDEEKMDKYKIAFETDDTLAVFYFENYDPVTEQEVKGEFKDILIRVK